MSTTTLTRLSGLALIAACALSVAGGMLHPIIDGDSHGAASLSDGRFATAHLLVFLSGVYLLIGLPGLYGRMAPKAGHLGLAGYLLYFVANATIVTVLAGYEAFIAPVLAGDPATVEPAAADGAILSSPGFAALQGVGGTALMLGLLLFGIAVVRARVFPRWTGVLMAVAPVLLLAPVPETPVLTGLLIELPRGLAMATMGWMLFAHGGDERDAAVVATPAQFGAVAAR